MIKNIISNGTVNGLSNGMSNGLSNGTSNGLSNGKSNGFSNGTSNGLSNGKTNGLSNGKLDDTSNVIFRKAESKDMKEVFHMIWELASWEKMTHKLKLDEAQLTKDFINEAFYSIVAEAPDGSLVGYTIYNIDYSTWEGKSLSLVDIYIKEEYRGHKVGEKLFISVMKEGYANNCQKAHFHVLSWNPAIKFYKKLGCTDGGEYVIYRLEQENFKKLVLNN